MHIYFSAIGGTGIGPLAMLALDAGYTVSGSDLKESDMTRSLQQRGANIFLQQNGEDIARSHQLRPIEWYVHSSAIPSDHPEYTFAKENDIRISKRDEFLNFFLQERNLKLIAVSGTHGKTTTTAMLAWLAQQTSARISYLVGTSLGFGPSALYEPGANYFFYECDEFDKNFLSFHPELSIITTMDYDHPDTYPTPDEYRKAFSQFAHQSKAIITWQEISNLLALEGTIPVQPLSLNDPGVQSIELTGAHMRQNAWLAAHAMARLYPEKDVAYFAGLLKAFPGTGRRFEKLADNLYSDYAHHPIEIAATIKMAKELNQNVVVVYQPHQNIRQHEIVRENAYAHCFDEAAMVYWLPTYLSREDESLSILSPTQLMVGTSPDTSTEYAEMNDVLWQKINMHRQKGDLVLAMSAGDLDTWLRQQIS